MCFKKFISIVFLLMTFVSRMTVIAQVERDQDLVTLKNGYQLLGYIVEQRPGKLIKVYRPVEQDTVEVALTDISKLTKIWVQPFSEKKIEQGDSLIPGRYNNKKHVFTASYVMQWRDIERRERRGIGFSWHRNRTNWHQIGFGAVVYGRQDPEPQRSDLAFVSTRHSLEQYHLLFSNQFRMGKRVQNRRFSTLFTLNTGWVIDRSNTSINAGSGLLQVRYEEFKSGFTFQSGLAFRINPDNQSGFIIEPGYSFYPQQVNQYSGEPGSAGGVYLGSRREVNHLFTMKLSYFF